MDKVGSVMQMSPVGSKRESSHFPRRGTSEHSAAIGLSGNGSKVEDRTLASLAHPFSLMVMMVMMMVMRLFSSKEPTRLGSFIVITVPS